MRRRVKSLARDTRGVAAVEFALLAPLMLVLYFGMVEFCQGYMAQKRADHVASMVADLTAQESDVTKAELTDYFAIGDLIMKPFSSATLKQRVSSVTRISSTTYRIDWSQTKGMTQTLQPTQTGIPANLLANGESVIIGESFYTYDSVFRSFLPKPITFERRTYLRPRTVDLVTCSDC